MERLSVIIPAYNEEEAIKESIKELKKELDSLNLEYEIIVVNDASTDKTGDILKEINDIKLINHPYNKGYGAALKTGIKNAEYENLLFFDADRQHRVEHIKDFIKHMNDFDLVAGSRVGYKGPFIRQPGKRVLGLVANYLTRQKIPDLNCGFRVAKKDKIQQFDHLLCNGLSFSTTTLLLFLNEGLNVRYVPIKINKRSGGKSSVKPRHALDTLIIILRTILLSSPLRIFLPVSFVLLLASLASGIYDLFFRPLNLTDSTIILFISFLLIFFFGLIADQLASIRKEMKRP